MLIQHGTIISPKNQLELSTDVRIENGLITQIGALTPQEGETVIDATGCIVAPGLIDVHVHFRDPGQTYKEDLHTGACAAAAGGFTSVVCMANTRPAVDCPEVLEDILTRASQEKIRIFQAASVTKGLAGKELTDFEALAKAGACGFTDDGIPLLDEKLTALAMEKARALNLPLSFHEEHPAFITQSGAHATAPAVAEDLLVARDCMLALHTGAVISIQHISSKNSVALLRTAKALGAHVYAEATPHHFSLTEEALKEHGTLAKMNPPLRTEEDRRAIIEGLRDGTIDMIVTDHAPHSTKEKARPFDQAPSGIIGLETSLALGITNLVRPGHLTMQQLMEKMSVHPAELYHLPYDTISEGAAADLVIFNPDERICLKTWHSRSCNSPFTGTELYGAIKYTICRGEIAYQSC
ncbi:MAG: dihydroorotase [Lachnospiraceae bacterium]|nr:dihydroorotase [Lachnospiraceae bacterium]